MITSLRPRTLFVLAVLFAAGGIALAYQAWVSSPQLRVPVWVAYCVAAVALIGAVMIALQAAGVERWNDLLAAGLLLAGTAAFLWMTFGRGPRVCRYVMWQLPDRACRGGWGVGAAVLGAMAVWALRRYRARSRDP